MAIRSSGERLAALDQTIDQKKAQRKALESRVKEEERRKRTRRLIELGGTIEKYCGTITDMENFDSYVKQYANAIKEWDKNSSKKPPNMSTFLYGE